MKTAFAYSSANINNKYNSLTISEQFNYIKKYAKENNIEIIKLYFDTQSIYHNSSRTQFYKMIEEAQKIKPDFIISYSNDIFLINKDDKEVEGKLHKHNIFIKYIETNYINQKKETKKQLQENINKSNSKIITGMKENLHMRDPKTGWCYKNGGLAPFGYKIQNIICNNLKESRLKSIWIIDAYKANLLKEILLDLRLNKKLSYSDIKDQLNNRNIKTNKNNSWTISSIADLFKEARLMTYAGYYVWNKKNSKSSKINKKENWIIIENAHEPIISKTEMNQLLKMQQFFKKVAPKGRTKNSSFLLTGYNLNGNPLFICDTCKKSMVGEQNNKFGYYKYVCGNHKSKGINKCKNSNRINRNVIENLVISKIKNLLSNKDVLTNILAEYNTMAKKNNTVINIEINDYTIELDDIKFKLNNLLNAIKSGIEPKIIKQEINELHEKKQQIENEIVKIKTNLLPQYTATDNFDSILINFKEKYNKEDLKGKKNLIKCFIDFVEFSNDQDIEIHFNEHSIAHTLGKNLL